MPELLAVATTATLDLRDLVRALQRALPDGRTVRATPGLLARDDEGVPALQRARRRGATILIVAPANADLPNHAGLTVGVARQAGLAVCAVVVVGPGSHGERGQLRDDAAVDVVELADLRTPSGDVVRWPLQDWLQAEPVVAGGEALALTPYGGWEPPADGGPRVPDPRTAGREVLMPALEAIVAAEGPVLASRAYGLLNKAAGGKKLTSIVRAPLSSAAYRLRAEGRIEIEDAPGSPTDEILRATGTPPVRVRELGPRTLDDVPLDEVAELMRRVRAAGGPASGPELRRATLEAYGLRRMTAHADDLLEAAETLAVT